MKHLDAIYRTLHKGPATAAVIYSAIQHGVHVPWPDGIVTRDEMYATLHDLLGLGRVVRTKDGIWTLVPLYCDACGYTREEVRDTALYLGIQVSTMICCEMPDAAPPDVHTALGMEREGEWWDTQLS